MNCVEWGPWDLGLNWLLRRDLGWKGVAGLGGGGRGGD